jgi:ketosteroid isomerase-like protein
MRYAFWRVKIMKRIFVASLVVLLSLSCSTAQDKANLVQAADVIEQLKDLEHKWDQALVASDTETLKQILSDDFTSSAGAAITKEAYLLLLQISKGKQTATNKTDMRVRVYGNTAVVLGRQTVTYKYENGSGSGVFNFMDVWVKQSNGQWQCVAMATDETNKNEK